MKVEPEEPEPEAMYADPKLIGVAEVVGASLADAERFSTQQTLTQESQLPDTVPFCGTNLREDVSANTDTESCAGSAVAPSSSLSSVQVLQMLQKLNPAAYLAAAAAMGLTLGAETPSTASGVQSSPASAAPSPAHALAAKDAEPAPKPPAQANVPNASVAKSADAEPAPKPPAQANTSQAAAAQANALAANPADAEPAPKPPAQANTSEPQAAAAQANALAAKPADGEPAPKPPTQANALATKPAEPAPKPPTQANASEPQAAAAQANALATKPAEPAPKPPVQANAAEPQAAADALATKPADAEPAPKPPAQANTSEPAAAQANALAAKPATTAAADAQLKAMGWIVEYEGLPAAEAAAAPTPQAIAQAPAAAPTPPSQAPAPTKEYMPPSSVPTGPYSRRAAANLLNRLKANPKRQAALGMPESWRDKLVNDASSLIDELCEASGDLTVAIAAWTERQEHQECTRNKDVSKPITYKQLQDIYGGDADKVAQRKRDQNLVVKDKNDSRIELFLHFSEEVEMEDTTLRVSSTSSAADMTGEELQRKKASLKGSVANLAISRLTDGAAPSASGGTPPEPEPKPRAKGKAAAKSKVINLDVCSPLEKAQDLLSKILKSKTQASDLSLQLRSVPYAEELQKKMGVFASGFESLYLQVHDLVSKEVNTSEPYLAMVNEYVQLQQTYEQPVKAAGALAKGVAPKKRQAKAKAGSEQKRQKQ